MSNEPLIKSCTFKKKWMAVVSFTLNGDSWIRDIPYLYRNNRFFLLYPQNIHRQLTPDIKRQISQELKQLYLCQRRQSLDSNHDSSTSLVHDVQFGKEKMTVVDFELVDEKITDAVYTYYKGNFYFRLPFFYDVRIYQALYPMHQITEELKNHYLRQFELSKEETEENLEKNETNPFQYQPNTVLRALKKEKDEKTLSLTDYVRTLYTKEISGKDMSQHIAFQFSVLEWLYRLEYMTTRMFKTLVDIGYIPLEYKGSNFSKKFNRRIETLKIHSLIEFSQFVVLGEEIEAEPYHQKIKSIGKAAPFFFRELFGKNVKYNPFLLYRDGNTVKKRLSANQWLLYWLQNFNERIGWNFFVNQTVETRENQQEKLVIQAVVQLEDRFIVGESVRRVAREEVAYCHNQLLQKIHSFIKLLTGGYPLYSDNRVVEVNGTPIITIIAEDDEHLTELYDLLKNNLSREELSFIWLTTDNRLFYEHYEEWRFVYFDTNKQLAVVNLLQV